MMIAQPKGWQPPIVKTISTENEGMDQVWSKVSEHQSYLYETNQGLAQRQKQLKLEVYDLIREEIWREVKAEIEQDHQKQEVFNNPDADPYQLARSWFQEWMRKGE